MIIVIERLIPTKFVPNYLQELFAAVDFDVPLLKFKMPPIDLERGLFYGYRVRATHALHGEYGPPNDLLGVVNTMPT